MTIHFGDSTSIATATGLGAKFINAVQLVKTARQTGNVSGETTIMEKAITPSSSSSKILVSFHVSYNAADNYHGHGFKLYRGSTNIMVPDAVGTMGRHSVSGHRTSDDRATANLHGMFLDSPSTTSSTTYYVKIADPNGTSFYINRARNGGTGAGEALSCSTLTLMEVAV